jgi:predicted nucleotidyltransferase
MDEPALSPREYHAERERERLREREELRQEWLAKTREAVRRVAPAHPAVRAVYLFGSLVQPGRFQRGSDLDLALDCDDPRAESDFWRALEEALERDVDLRAREGAIARAVEDEGELVYERAVPAARAQD